MILYILWWWHMLTNTEGFILNKLTLSRKSKVINLLFRLYQITKSWNIYKKSRFSGSYNIYYDIIFQARIRFVLENAEETAHFLFFQQQILILALKALKLYLAKFTNFNSTLMILTDEKACSFIILLSTIHTLNCISIWFNYKTQADLINS